MSVQAISWVIEQSEATLADRLVLLSIANHCNNEGVSAWPSINTIARESRISERQAKRSIKDLQDIGELECHRSMGPGGTNYFVMKKMIRPRCWYCGADLFMSDRHNEHQVPVSRGGSNDLTNIVYSCRPCNLSKHDKTVDEYKAIKGVSRFFAETSEGRQFVTRPGVQIVTRGVTNSPRQVDQMSPEPSFNRPLKHISTLPEWVPVEQWNGFVQMRKQMPKTPFTERAKVLAISELEKLRKQGHDPGAVLDQSTMKGWRGLFPISTGNGGKNDHYKTAAQLRNERSRRNIEAAFAAVGDVDDDPKPIREGSLF